MSLVKVEHSIAVALLPFARRLGIQAVGQVERAITRAQAVERDKLAVYGLLRHGCIGAIARLLNRDSQLRSHKRLGKANLKRRLIGIVIDRIGSSGIEQPLELRGHGYGVRSIGRVVGGHAIRHGIQIHVSRDRLALKPIPRLRSAIGTHISPLQEEFAHVTAGRRPLIELRNDLGISVRVIRDGLLFHHGIALVIKDRVATLIHLGNIDVMNETRARRSLVVRVDRRRKDDRPVDTVIAHLMRRDLVHRGVGHALKGLTALEGILLVIGHQGVFAIGFIVARPADKVVLGAVNAHNLLDSLDLKRNLVAGISTAETADKSRIREI